MLEGPLKTWICHFLGQYVESETVHVSTKLWTSSERLKLENLTLKKSVIPAWLPFKLKTGFIGQFEADLPISAIFGSGSAKIKFSDVLLVLAPLCHDEDEQREEIESLVEQKLQHLEQDVLDRWEGPHVPEYTVPHESEGYFGVDGWLGRTITKLIDNLQIDVRNLHIRIEGVWFPPPTSPLATAAPPRSRGTSPTTGPASSAPPTSTNSSGVKFAAGFSLSALSAVTTPSNWRVDGFDDGKPTPNTDTSHLVFKLINALDLSVYVDPNALHFIHSSVHPKVLQSALSRLQEMNKLKTSRPDWWNSEENVHTHRFLIAPIAVALKLTMNTAAQHAQTEDPRYNAAFHLSKLAAALDEEQLSVLNLIIDSYCRHEEWRVKVSEQLKADERAGVRENDKMGSSIEEYLGLWKQVDELKKGGLEQVKTTPAWKSLTDLERGLPFELVVSLRNRGSTDQAEETNERASFSSLFHEMGDAMGIPLPEISVVFTEGPTGLVLDITKNRDVVVVSRSEQGQAAKKESVKPGLIIVAVDGKPLKSVVKYTTAVDVQVYLDSMQGSRSITFRHPLVVAPEVTPQRLVSKVVFTSDDLSFRLVRASKKLVLAKLALDQPLVMIRGYGPELFSFHQYEVQVLDFYLQNNSWDPNGTSHCIASSVTSPRNGDKARTDRKAIFRLGMDYLYDGHPDAVPGKVSTYGSKISLHVGDSVLVIDDDKMTSLMTDWYEFCAAISSQYADSSSTIASEGNRYGTGETVSLTSSGVTIVSNNTIGEDLTTLVPPRVVSSYSYDFKVDQIMIFVTAASKAALPASITSQPSYRTLLKQLVNKESSSVQIVPPDWVRATQAIVLIQRFLRGAVVRKRQLVQIGLSRSRWMRFQSEERMGWLYSRDDTLAFRRWRRSWCHVGEDGVFSIHTDGSGAELLDEFKVRRWNVTLVPNTVKGPWGLRKTCHLLEIRSTSTGQLRKVLSSEALSELEVWRSCIELSARNAIKRRNLRGKDRTDSTMTTDSTDPPDVEEIEPEEAVPQPPPMFLYEEPRYSAVAAEALLMGGFSDSYESSTALYAAKSKWISINATDLHFMTDVHRVSEPQQSAFHIYIGVQYLSVLDHRKKMNHGLLHIGDEFLGLKNGVLTPARIRADRVKGGPFLALSLSYRGAHATTNTFDFQEGLHADLDISGWCLPLNLYEVMFEVLDVISVFWTDPTVSQENQETDNASNDPWYRVAALDLHIRAPIIEGYLEDTNCVAKLSLENSVFGYKADRFMESAKIHLGPTALFVLTDEVALRLAQVEKCWINYELRMQRFLFASDAQQNKCDLCQDENAKRAVCHRSVTMTLGQVKLEADRRLELLFALIEALTSVEEQPSPDTFPDDEFNFVDNFEEEKMSEVQPVASQSSASRQLRSAFDGAPLTVDCLPTERLQRMMQFDDHDLRPMYAQFGRQISAGNLGSPSGRSRLSSATTAQNWQSQDENVPYDRNGNQQSRSRPVSWIPLLNYQVYIGILPPEAPSRTRTLFRLRLRSGRIHDHISLSCSSIVFEVIKRSLSVVALDTYIPVMNFSISDMKVLATTRTEFSNDAGVDASVEISARYYNSALADWEPFVEPWRTYARITVDDGENGTSVQLSAMQRLNVNITDALVRLLSSMAKNRKKQVTFFEKRTPSAVAADGEAKKEDGRVCVLNNLGAPIRLANLNTSQPGTLHVEVRDGWSYPAYTRFHDVRVQVVLLPWWHPREAKRVDSIRHKFSLPYGGAQSGVTPILRVDVSTFGTGKRNFVFDQVARRYVEVEGDDADLANDMEMPTLTQHRSTPSLSRLARDESSGSAPRPRWCSIGSAEINLVGSVMGSLGSRGTKMSRWYRLRDVRGNVTGEIFVALDFVPFAKMSGHDDDFDAAAEPDQVRDGQFLVFDPLKTLSAKELKPAHSLSSSLSRRSNRSRPPSSKQIVLSHGLRASYVPPLALEVMLGGTRCSLLCPLRRAGKFLIQGDRVLAEVKVAQRDESRRVLLLSSPVQLKNATSIDIELWSCPTTAAVGESGVFGDARRLSVVSTSSKLSVPLSAIYGESQQSIIIKVDGCKPTVVANLGQLSAGSLLIMLDPEEGHVSGFCLFVSTTSYMRKVYREEHQDIVSRGVGVSGGGGAVPGTPSPPASQAQPQSYATKYQICLHACLVFENTLPVRVQYRVVIPRNQSDQREILLRSGTLSPGEDVNLYEFHSNAHLLLRLPEMDSIWCKPINLGDCMYREGMGKDVKAMLNASGYWAPIVEFIPSLQSSGIAFKEEDIESKKVVARLDYTNAEDGSPRVVLYASLWIYNQSHVPMLQFRCADDGTHSPTIAVPQIIPQRPVPRPMDCPNQTFEISTVIDYEVSRWSEKIHATVVGIQAPIPLKFGSSLGPKMRHEIGISIQRPLGQFHRTTQVIVMPRFVIVNKTTAAFKISPHGKDSDHVIEIPAADDRSHSSIPFDFDAAGSAAERLLFIRMDHTDAEWSGPFAVDEETEFPLKLQGNVESNWKRNDAEELARRYGRGGDLRRSSSKMYRVKVRIHTVGPTMVVSIMRDDPATFVIRNESSWDLYVNQQNSSEDTVVVRTKEFVPFAWARPERSRRVTCRVGLPGHTHPKGFGSRVYDFNNLDRDRGIDDLRFWLFGNQLRRIQADISVEESSRVLVFRDHNTERPTSYVLEVKVIAARFFHELSIIEDPTAEIILETDNQNVPAASVESKELRTAHVYRFDADSEFSCESRPKRLTLSLYQNHRTGPREEVVSIGVDDDSFLEQQIANDSPIHPTSPTGGGEAFGMYEMLQTPSGSPRGLSQTNSSRLSRRQAFRSAVPESGSFHEAPLHFSDVERVSHSDVSSDRSEVAENVDDGNRTATGVVEIKIPRKAWSKFGVSTRRSVTWSYNNMPHALYSLGGLEGHWWEMRDPESGELVGEVQVALKFRTTAREYTHPTDVFNVSVQIPSIGFSFLHSASSSSSLVDVAYLSLQRLALVYSCVGDSSEVACSLGNLQMDNQMDAEVVLGPKVHHMKEGVSVRLRDRWRGFRNHQYRGICEQLDTSNLSFLQFRTLWNSRCKAGDITHYELVEFIMQEVEISTDEKFVVNLITVFQGLGTLSSHHTFDDIVNTQVDYTGGGGVVDERGAVADGVYIEELHLEAIRVKFSMELNGGRHLKTLGPSGRRLAVYLPESNVKDFRLYFSTVTYTHVYETKANVVEKITRRYQQQAVILVLRGLYTVSVYANPFRIAYRLGHGILEVFRLPARGLASGSPVELVSGAYLGVRSLAMNTISAGYEIVAGASAIVAALVGPLLPESRRRAFEDEMLGFQRAVIEEVDSFDAAEERTMTKVIVRKPREFDVHGVGLLTVYGPGSVPMEEQDRIDYRAAVVLQQWWRRHRRANRLWTEALRLRPDLLDEADERSSRDRVVRCGVV